MTRDDIDGITGLLGADRYLDALDRLIPLLYPAQGPADPQAESLRDQVFAALGQFLRSARHPPRTRMKFGTSGWRGLLGDDFTVANVMRLTQGLCDALLGQISDGQVTPEVFRSTLGVPSNDDLRRRGAVLAHDTRFFGPELCDAAARVLLAHDIPVIYLGTATTPEVSAALYETGAAFSINLTPSHNPYGYHGYKFNPADGGPATRELTGPVERRANQIFDGDLPVRALSEDELQARKSAGQGYRRADPVALYRKSLVARLPFLDPALLCARINQAGLDLFIDNGFGATTGKYEALLSGVDAARLHIFNPAPDYLFGGKNREPSPENFRELQRHMATSSARLCLGVMNDGDGDRFVGGGRRVVLNMNRFGPLCVRYLSQRRGLRGDVTRSLMTSHMADAARARYAPGGQLHETRVGFQFMKAFIPTSLNSFEESDGMSPLGWSRDKDGLCAALLQIAITLDEDLPAEELDALLTQELGHFDFERRKITGRLSGEPLAQALRDSEQLGAMKPGQILTLAGVPPLTLAAADLRDGVKLRFSNGWWLGVRASGTEPAARSYVETSAPPDATADQVAALAAGREALQRYAAEVLRRIV